MDTQIKHVSHQEHFVLNDIFLHKKGKRQNMMNEWVMVSFYSSESLIGENRCRAAGLGT